MTDASLIATADRLGAIVDAVRPLVDECRLNFDADGLSIAAVDPANVASVYLDAPARFAESYDVPGDAVIGVDLTRLSDVVGLFDGDDLLDVTATSDYVIVTDGRLRATVGTIAPDSIRAEPTLPDLEAEQTATAVIEGAVWERAKTAAGTVLSADDGPVTVAIDDDGVQFRADGDLDAVDLTVDREETLSLLVDEPAEALYSHNYLAEIGAAMGSNTEASLRLGTEYPLTLQYSVADGSIQLEYTVAPRIDQEGR